MQEDNEHESHAEYVVNKMNMMNMITDEYAAISKKRMHLSRRVSRIYLFSLMYGTF